MTRMDISAQYMSIKQSIYLILKSVSHPVKSNHKVGHTRLIFKVMSHMRVHRVTSLRPTDCITKKNPKKDLEEKQEFLFNCAGDLRFMYN